MQLPPTILSTDKKRNKKSGGKTDEARHAHKPAKTSGNKRPSDVSVSSVKSEEAIAQEVDISSNSTSEDETDKDKAPAMPSDDAPGSRRLQVNGLTPSRSLETTLFDRLEKMYGPGIKRLLNVQYRCVFFRIA